MCLILFSISPDPRHRLVVAANRDEFYARPTERPAFWDDAPHILGGRDLQAGGTWLGVTSSGRFAAVTNFRETPSNPLPPRSRGALTADFLRSNESCASYLARIAPISAEFRGFNLLIDDGRHIYYYSNRQPRGRRLEPGFYGLSNQLLDCNWPKVSQGRKQLRIIGEQGFDTESLFELLADEGNQEPFSAGFIQSDAYGTSASTVVKISNSSNIEFEGRAFLPLGQKAGRRQFTFPVILPNPPAAVES